MNDDRDAPVHDASRDDLSLLRRGAPPARARRRSAWAPEPTTEAGRRRRRRARWATAGIVAAGLVFGFGRLVVTQRTREANRRAASAAALDAALVLHVTSSEVDGARSLVFTLATGADAFAFGGDDPMRFVLALPAEEPAIERTVDAIVADIVRRGVGRPVSWPFGVERDDDRALADQVLERVRVRGSGAR